MEGVPAEGGANNRRRIHYRARAWVDPSKVTWRGSAMGSHDSETPRLAEAADIRQLIELRADMLRSLGQDPGQDSAAWRSAAFDWFGERLLRPECRLLVIGAPAGAQLVACGAAWLIDRVPNPTSPHGRRGYIDLMYTVSAARGRGYGRRIAEDLVAWLSRQAVRRVELHASPDGERLYRWMGFAHDPNRAMFREFPASLIRPLGQPRDD